MRGQASKAREGQLAARESVTDSAALGDEMGGEHAAGEDQIPTRRGRCDCGQVELESPPVVEPIMVKPD